MKRVLSSNIIRSTTFYDVENELYKSNFAQAIELLQDFSTEARKSYYFHLLYGIGLFNTDRLDKAQRSFNLALELVPDDVFSHLYLAAISLRNHKTDLALSMWVDVLKIDAKNVYAKRSMRIFRNIESNAINEMAKKIYTKGLLPRFVPHWVQRRKKRNRIFLAIVGIALLLSAPFYSHIQNTISSYVYPKNERSNYLNDLSNTNIPDTELLNDSVGYTLEEILQFPIREALSERNIAALMQDFEIAFIKYKENRAQMLANSVFYSDASISDKTRTYIVQKNIGMPSYISDVKWFAFDEIKDTLWQYHNITVKWQGTVTNISLIERENNKEFFKFSENIKEDSQLLKANFLLNFFANQKEVSAIIPIYFLPTIRLQNGDEVELLASLKYNEESIDSFPNIVEKNLHIALLVQGFRYILE